MGLMAYRPPSTRRPTSLRMIPMHSSRTIISTKAMAAAKVAEVEPYVKSCGLYHRKAEDLVNASRMLLSDFGGRVPEEMDDLLRLPGVGRKIANLMRGDVFGQGGFVTDTHCIRICGRLGFYPEEQSDPVRTERIMTPLIPRHVSMVLPFLNS